MEVELDPVLGKVLVEAAIAPLDAPDFLGFIVVVEAHNEGSNDDVEARAETAAGDDGGFDLFALEENLFPRTCPVKLKTRL